MAKADEIDYKKYTMTTPIFRASFVDLFDGEKIIDEKTKEEYAKYSVTALFEKGEGLTQLKEMGRQLMTELWGADAKLWPAGFIKPWRDQGEKSKDNPNAQKTYDGYSMGSLFTNMSCYVKPQVFDQGGAEIFDKTKVYSGCYLRANVTVKWFDNKSKGLKLQLNAAQLIKDGEPLGGTRVSFAEVFTPVPVDTAKGAAAVFSGAAADDPMA